VAREWLGPVPGDESAVPAEHCVGSHDQQHLPEPAPVEHRGQHREDGSVGLGEPQPIDLTLQDQDLVAESENLSVALVTRGEQPTDP